MQSAFKQTGNPPTQYYSAPLFIYLHDVESGLYFMMITTEISILDHWVRERESESESEREREREREERERERESESESEREREREKKNMDRARAEDL